MASRKLSLLTVALLLSAAAAKADVSISNKPTSNMSCVSGVCTATAQKAVLNVSDLANMLASGDLAVKTGGAAKDINILQPLTWTSASRLTLDAQQSVSIEKQVTVAGQGSLTVVTNDTGNNGKTSKAKNSTGEFIVVPERGSVQFWDPSSSLVIDGQSYTLVYDIKTLASDIAANPSGFYALAKPYDASADGTYSSAPVSTIFSGILTGLGNILSKISVQFTANQPVYDSTFLSEVSSTGQVRSIGIAGATLLGTGSGSVEGLGLLASDNFGVIDGCWATGIIKSPGGDGAFPGGLVGGNYGIIIGSYASAEISLNGGTGTQIGGLAGYNQGLISKSAARGSLLILVNSATSMGGFAGYNKGTIVNAFTRAAVHDHRPNQNSGNIGGFIGTNEVGGQVRDAYSAGTLSGYRNQSNFGGFVGYDSAPPGNLSRVYWDIDKGISDPSDGAGNRKNDAGISGLTTHQLQSAIPRGFNPREWKQSVGINGGLPFLNHVPTK